MTSLTNTITKVVSSSKMAEVLSLLIIRNEASYNKALEVMKTLMLNTPDTPENPLNDFMESLAQAIEHYEETTYPFKKLSPIEYLKELISERDMKQKDLAHLLGVSNGLVSDILNEHKNLTVPHIQKLASYFKVPSALFIP